MRSVLLRRFLSCLRTPGLPRVCISWLLLGHRPARFLIRTLHIAIFLHLLHLSPLVFLYYRDLLFRIPVTVSSTLSLLGFVFGRRLGLGPLSPVPRQTSATRSELAAAVSPGSVTWLLWLLSLLLILTSGSRPVVLSAMLSITVVLICPGVVMVVVFPLPFVSFVIFPFAVRSSIASCQPRRRFLCLSFSWWRRGWEKSQITVKSFTKLPQKKILKLLIKSNYR